MLFNRVSVNYFIIFSGIVFFLIRWHQPFLMFNETIDAKIIFESVSDGYKYLPSFKLFSEFNLNNSFDSEITNLKNLTAPVSSFYLHLFLYSIIKSWAFIALELLCIILFLGIFYKISRLLDFKRETSFLISIFLYNLPLILDLTLLSNYTYISVISSDLYSLRFPRPLITNLFLYYFILITLSILNKGQLLKRKKFIIIGVASGLLFSSFLYHFLLGQITLIFCLIYMYKNKFFSFLLNNYISLIFLIIAFLVVSSPFLINLFFTEKDFLERVGALDLNLEKKKILINYTLKKFLDVKFVLVLIVSFFLIFLVNCKKYKKILLKNNIFIFLFFSSIISPIIFIIFSPTFFSHFYFFNNLTVIIFFLFIFFIFSKLIQEYLFKNISRNKFNFFSLITIILFIFLNFFGVRANYISNQLDNENYKLRNEFNNIIDIIKKNEIDLKVSSLLTFDNKVMTWFILNDIKNIKIVNGIFVSKTHEMVENDLIKSFKFLNLNKNDLRKFLSNKKMGWRYRNDNVMNLFWFRYQANSLTTFKNSKDFDKDILNFIKTSSPAMSQQLIMPNFEIERLVQKFVNYKKKHSVPDLIIINKNDSILSKSIIDYKIFCKNFDGEIYLLYLNKKKINKCN